MVVTEYVTVESKIKPNKATYSETWQTDMNTDSESAKASSPVYLMMDLVFSSVDDTVVDQKPVQVKDDVIKVKEHLMKENTPYVFVYQGKEYVISRSQGTTRLYELRD